MTARSLRWYRRLLRAYPRAFRARFADGMCAAFARELERRRGARVVTLWFITVWHVVTMAPLEYLAEWRQRGGERRPGWLTNGLGTDLRVAFRGIRLNPVLSVTVVITLGVGIGGVTALFGLVNALLLRPLPLGGEDDLLRIRDTVARPGEATWWYDSSERSFAFIRDHGKGFSAVTGGNYQELNVTGTGESATVVGSGVAARWLETLGVRPVLGRGFTTEEQALGDAARVIIIGYGLWATRFGRDPAVLGRSLTVNGLVYTIVGVMPAGFTFPYGAQLWVMDTFDAAQSGGGVYVVVRRGEGMNADAVADELSRLSRAAREAYPDSHRGISFTGIPVRQDLVGNRTRVGLALLSGVGVLLLIACANVANLLTIRAVSRRREFAVRAALGATRWRQMRHLWTETILLTSLGWVLGLSLTVLFGDSLAALSVSGVESFGAQLREIDIDVTVLGFSLILTGLTAIATAALPLMKTTRWGPRLVIAEESTITARRSQPALSAVVVSEMSLAFILLLGSVALMDDLARLERTPLGFEPENRLVASLALSPLRYAEPGDRVRFMETLEERMRGIPEVQAVGSTQHTPVSLGDWTGSMTIEGGHESTPVDRLLTNVRSVTPGYFEAIGARLVTGRTFSREEMDEVRGVVIVTETMARAQWRDQNAIGRRVKFGPVAGSNSWLEVVGVVGDVKEEWNGVDPTWYLPYRQSPLPQMHVVVEYSGDVESVQASIRRVVREIDVEQPIADMRTLTGLVEDSFSSERFGAGLAVILAAVGLTLAVLGVYGVLSFAVRQRSREIGLRMALGSSVGGMIRRIVGAGLTMLGIATAVSLTLLPLVNRLTRIEWSDGDVNQFRLLSEGLSVTWVRLILVLGTLVVATVAASYLPARRAVRVSPAKILREG